MKLKRDDCRGGDTSSYRENGAINCINNTKGNIHVYALVCNSKCVFNYKSQGGIDFTRRAYNENSFFGQRRNNSQGLPG